MRQPGRDRNAACHLRTAPWRQGSEACSLAKKAGREGGPQGQTMLAAPFRASWQQAACCFQGVAGPDHLPGSRQIQKKPRRKRGLFYSVGSGGFAAA